MLTIRPVPLSVFSTYLKGMVSSTIKDLFQVNIPFFFCVSHEVYLYVFLLYNIILKQLEVGNIKGSAGLYLERAVILNSEHSFLVLYPSTFKYALA